MELEFVLAILECYFKLFSVTSHNIVESHFNIDHLLATNCLKI